MNYVSLFSSAGVGCYGFHMEGYKCLATAELIERRLNIQRINNKCELDEAYVCGDLTQREVRQDLFKVINKQATEIDVVIATPPCQGMSVANHKKKNELGRNSLVIESIKIVKELSPKIFIFENVRAFMNTVCTDVDGKDKKISDAIVFNLGGEYNIESRIINFKDYGSNSSRTRTLVIGTLKNIEELSPLFLFPQEESSKTLKEIIGDLPRLNEMGQFSKEDFWHFFRKYPEHMRAWISHLKEGESAFDNTDPNKRPHRIIDGKIKYNVNKNGDKYKRNEWNKVAPCIHTRNDILASQSTIHPEDDRVFSIRELNRCMTIPESFKWVEENDADLNKLSQKEKVLFLKKNEMNIRQSIGEAVPTAIFWKIAKNIKRFLQDDNIKEKELKDFHRCKILSMLRDKDLNYKDILILSKIFENNNSERQTNGAFYTCPSLVHECISNIPEFGKIDVFRILEPSVGTGAFVDHIIESYRHFPKVELTLVDIDAQALDFVKEKINKIGIPDNFEVKYVCGDFLKTDFDNNFDLVVGNPPFGKMQKSYLDSLDGIFSTNIVGAFWEKALKIARVVSFITPKSILSTPEFGELRAMLSSKKIECISDFGEKGFRGVKIETVNIIASSIKKIDKVKVYSRIRNNFRIVSQSYILDNNLPTWVIYRDNFFDKVFSKMLTGVFKVYRDRQITKKHTKDTGKFRVLKSRNVSKSSIVSIDGYDQYVDNVDKFAVSKFLNKQDIIAIPNLTYYPRATFLPKNTIADGSIALLEHRHEKKLTDEQIDYIGSKEFEEYYRIARNYGTRSLNIDSNTVNFFGELKVNE